MTSSFADSKAGTGEPGPQATDEDGGWCNFFPVQLNTYMRHLAQLKAVCLGFVGNCNWNFDLDISRIDLHLQGNEQSC